MADILWFATAAVLNVLAMARSGSRTDRTRVDWVALGLFALAAPVAGLAFIDNPVFSFAFGVPLGLVLGIALHLTLKSARPASPERGVKR
jgi:hypothetical protein